MNSKTRYGIVLALAATVFGSLILFSPLILAQQSSSSTADQPRPSTTPANQPKELTLTPAGCQICQIKMQQLETMGKLTELLAQAKEAAQIEAANETLAKITGAQNLLEQWHQAIHKELSQHMQKMHQDMKCPLCGKIAKSNEELSQHIQTIHQGMKCPLCGKTMAPSAQGEKIEKPKTPVPGY